MLCDECHKHEANIYVTEITSQGQIEHHLCEFCATKLDGCQWSSCKHRCSIQ